MPSFIETLLALNGGNLPPLPDAAPSMPLPLTTAGQPPTPQYGGPSQVTEPPQAPFDPRIIAQYLATQAPPPQAPAPPSRAQQIANALVGFSAGVQGRGPQFLQQLQEPQRTYEAQLADYNANRSRLAGLGLEAGLRQQELKTRRAQEVSDQQFEQEARREARRLNITDQQDFERFKDTLLSARQRQQQQAADERLLQQQKLKFADDVRNQIKFYKSKGVDNSTQAHRLAVNDLSDVATQLGIPVPPLTAADNQRLAKVAADILKEQAQTTKAGRAPAGKAAKFGPVMAQLEDGTIVPMSSVDKRSGGALLNGKFRKVVGYVGGKLPAQQQAAPQNSKADPLGIR